MEKIRCIVKGIRQKNTKKFKIALKSTVSIGDSKYDLCMLESKCWNHIMPKQKNTPKQG